MSLFNCPECDSKISDKAKNCPKCGAPVILKKETFNCFECSKELESGTKVCDGCGAEQEIISQPKTEQIKIIPELKKKNNKALYLGLFAGIGLIILIAVIKISMKGSSPESQNETQDFDVPQSLNESYNNSTNDYNEIPSSSTPSNKSNTKSITPRKKTPDELRQELQDQEKISPLNYLSITYDLTVKVHLLKDNEDVINGTIYNYATIAIFKNIGIRVKFLTATNVLLGTRDYTLYEYVYANASKEFQIKVVSPNGTKKIDVDIISAKAEDFG